MKPAHAIIAATLTTRGWVKRQRQKGRYPNEEAVRVYVINVFGKQADDDMKYIMTFYDLIDDRVVGTDTSGAIRPSKSPRGPDA